MQRQALNSIEGETDMSEPTELEDAAQNALQTLERDLQTARDDLDSLERDRITLITLADGHELGYERLREANAPMPARVEIKAQLSAVKELILEQDEAIKDARVRVADLEQQYQVAGLRSGLHADFSTLQGLEQQFYGIVKSLNEVMNPDLLKLEALWREWTSVLDSFSKKANIMFPPLENVTFAGYQDTMYYRRVSEELKQDVSLLELSLGAHVAPSFGAVIARGKLDQLFFADDPQTTQARQSPTRDEIKAAMQARKGKE